MSVQLGVRSYVPENVMEDCDKSKHCMGSAGKVVLPDSARKQFVV